VAPGGGRGHNRGNCTNVYIGKEYFKNFLFKNHRCERAEICIKVFRQYKRKFVKVIVTGVWWGHNKGHFLYLKTVEFSTPQLYIFLFLVSKSIRWCVGHDHPG
jgi:hypothetical protein